jgi:hypothetical protein
MWFSPTRSLLEETAPRWFLGDITPLSPHFTKRLCRKGENGKNVMLNLFQHLIESTTYETLNQVQGDKKAITT